VYIYEKNEKKWSRENYDVSRSRLFMHDEQEFSVLDRCYIVVAGLSSDHFYMVHGILSYFARNLLLLELG